MSRASSPRTSGAATPMAAPPGAWLQRKCACGGSAGLGGHCSECERKKALGLQTRLAVGAAHDPLEEEADRVAEQVTRPQLASPPRVQRASAPAASAQQAEPAPAGVDQVLASGGRALDAPLRQDFEQRFGHDFSRVRIHADEAAARSAQALGASAWTVGRHIAFAPGRFAPESRAGRQLLAHELAHVVQQGGGASGSRLMRKPDETKALENMVRYDGSNFGDRFEAEVRPKAHHVSLVMRLAIEDYGPEEGKEDRASRFRARTKEVIEQTWSWRYAVQSVCHGDSDKFHASVRVDLSSNNPHHTIQVWPDMPGERSSSTQWQQSDTQEKERQSPVLIDPKKPPTANNLRMATFRQTAVAHEFGHLMGLDHIVCASNADRCYGITAEQKMDIMGYGSVVSQRDYAPFVQIMERYGLDRLPKECNKWRLVASG